LTISKRHAIFLSIMKLTETIRKQIEGLPEGEIFGYAQLGIAGEAYQSAAKVLERLQQKGVIKKVSKGVFYKPQKTIFGELKPNEQEQLKPYLYENGKRIAYVTGTSLYNQMGLTTQIAFQIKIASRGKRIFINRGAIKARPVKSYAEVTEENYRLLGFLDAIKDLKTIPDTPTKDVLKILSSKIDNLTDKQIAELIYYALRYPPRVRAVTGAILEYLKRNLDIAPLKNSLNPLSTYKLGIKPDYLPTAQNWNIE